MHIQLRSFRFRRQAGPTTAETRTRCNGPRRRSVFGRDTDDPYHPPHFLQQFYAEPAADRPAGACRSEEHTSELQSLMRISYAVFCLKKKYQHHTKTIQSTLKTE